MGVDRNLRTFEIAPDVDLVVAARLTDAMIVAATDLLDADGAERSETEQASLIMIAALVLSAGGAFVGGHNPAVFGETAELMANQAAGL